MNNLKQVWNINKDFLDVSEEQLNVKFSDAIIRQVMLMCQNMFKWENLPETIEPYMIEQWLFGLGWVGFAYDEKYGYMALWSNQYNFMDIDYRPTRVSLIGNGNVFNRVCYYGTETERTLLNDPEMPYDRDNACVIIKNNSMYMSTYDLIYPYVYSYYAVKRKEITMLDQLQLQSLIMASPEDRASLESVKRDIRKNKPLIAMNIKGMKSEPKPLVLSNNNNLLDLQTLAKSLYGEIMEHIGINSLNYEKAERMITSEVDQNKEQTMATADTLLKERELACDRINELFGLNVKVSLNQDIKLPVNEPSLNISAKAISHGAPRLDEDKEE